MKFDFIGKIKPNSYLESMYTVGEYTGAIQYCCRELGIPYKTETWKYISDHDDAISSISEMYDSVFKKWTHVPANVFLNNQNYIYKIRKISSSISREDMLKICDKMNNDPEFGEYIYQLNHGGSHAYDLSTDY